MDFPMNIQDYFALAIDYTDRMPLWPYFATPKMNGLRVMWVPGCGFVTRHGKPYADGVLPEIETALKGATMWLDGELYAHGLSLQEINSRAGVIRESPHPDRHQICFHVFDSPHLGTGFEARQLAIAQALPDHPNLKTVPYKNCNCCDHANTHHDAFVSAGFEGTVYKHPGGYRLGRTDMMVKRKAWQDEDFEIVELARGRTGKYDDTMGAILCRTKAGKQFRVGSFDGINDDERHSIWVGPKPKTAKVKFLGYTNDNIPYNARVMGVDY